MMRREVAESPVVVDGNTLVLIVEVSLQHWCDKRGTTFFGWKIPTAVVVISRTEEKALRMTGEEVPLEELSAKVEGMEEVLRQARRTPEAGPGRKEGSASHET